MRDACLTAKQVFGAGTNGVSTSPAQLERKLLDNSTYIEEVEHRFRDAKTRLLMSEKACRAALAERDRGHRAELARQAADHANEIQSLQEHIRVLEANNMRQQALERNDQRWPGYCPRESFS